MKKLKFLKNKLCLSFFALTTMSSLVLATCGPNNTTTSISPTNLLEEQKTIVNRKAVVDKLFSHPGFIGYLDERIVNNQMKLTKTLAFVENLAKINKTTMATSETSLGKFEDVASKEDNQTAFAYLNQLKLDLAESFKKSSSFKREFDALVANINTTTTNLTNKINALPSSKQDVAALKLNADAFTKAISDYIAAKDVNVASETWKKVEETFANLKVPTKKIISSLSELIKEAFALYAAVKAVESYVNNNAPDFIKEKTNVKTLNKFVDAFIGGVLADIILKKVWLADDQKNVSNDKLFFSLSEVAELANLSKDFPWYQKDLKNLKFSKALTFKKPIAINLLVLHVDDATYFDASRLNTYLLHEDTNAVKILEKEEIETNYFSEKNLTTTIVSLKSILDTLVTGTQWFKEYLMPTVSGPARLDLDLMNALNTEGITEGEKLLLLTFKKLSKN